jgi:acyl-CoA thioesterase
MDPRGELRAAFEPRPATADDPAARPAAGCALLSGSLSVTDRDAQQTADLVRDGMFRNDRASKWLGMQVLQVTPGRAVLAMTVRDEMLNGHDICHGGLIATLADSAFAFACNSYNELTVASGFAIELLAPGRLGDVLTATCHEVSKAGRTGVYDTEITNQHGKRVAVFRGRSHTVRGKPAVGG